MKLAEYQAEALTKNRNNFINFRGYDEDHDLEPIFEEALDFIPDTTRLGIHKPVLEHLAQVNLTYGLDLALTNTFRFSPGYLVKIKEKMMTQAFRRFDKRTKLHLLLDFNRWGFENFSKDLIKLQNDTTLLRTQGVTMKDAIDDGDAAYNTFIEQFVSSGVDEHLEDYFMNMSPSACTRRSRRFGDYRYHVRGNPYMSMVYNLGHVDMKVFSREGICIAVIPYGNLKVAFEYDLYHWINSMGGMPSSRPRLPNGHSQAPAFGAWIDSEPIYTSILHPYVQRDNDMFSIGNMCFGDFQQDIHQAVHSMEWVKLGDILREWSSVYRLGLTGPLNNISQTQIGLKKSYFENTNDPENNAEVAKQAIPVFEHGCQMIFTSEAYNHGADKQQFNDDHCFECNHILNCDFHNDNISNDAVDKELLMFEALRNSDTQNCWDYTVYRRSEDSNFRFIMGCKTGAIIRSLIPVHDDNGILASYAIGEGHCQKFNIIAALYDLMEHDANNAFRGNAIIENRVSLAVFAYHYGESSVTDLEILHHEVEKRKLEHLRQQEAIASLTINEDNLENQLNEHILEMTERENL